MNLLEKYKSILKVKGYKVTYQREKILDILIKNQYKHLTTEEIYEILRGEYPQVGVATVYRTIQVLENLNIVCEFDRDQDGIKYELVEINERYQHPHFICMNCKKIFPIKKTDFNLELVKNKLGHRYNFKVDNCNIKLYGICKECSRL